MNRKVLLFVGLICFSGSFCFILRNEIFRILVPHGAQGVPGSDDPEEQEVVDADDSDDPEDVAQSRPELTDEQQLIVAAFELRVATAERLIKAGVNVNSIMGPYDNKLFQDKRYRGYYIASNWTPLLAVSNSLPEPQPDKHFENSTEAEKVRTKIPQIKINKRNARRLKIAKMLVEAGAKLDEDDRVGATSLYDAVYHRYESLALYLIEKGAKVKIVDTGVRIDGPGDVTPLHRATRNSKIVDALIKAGADVNAKDTRGTTPLHWATLDANIKSVKLLIAAGADVNALDRKRRRPIDWARESAPDHMPKGTSEKYIQEESRKFEIYKLLKKAGAISK